MVRYFYAEDSEADSPSQEEAKAKERWENLNRHHKEEGAAMASDAKSDYEEVMAMFGDEGAAAPPRESIAKDIVDTEKYMEDFVRYEYFGMYFEWDTNKLPTQDCEYLSKTVNGWRIVDAILKRQGERLKRAFEASSSALPRLKEFFEELQKCPTLSVFTTQPIASHYTKALDIWTNQPISAGTAQVVLHYPRDKRPPICVFMNENRARILQSIHVVLFFWQYTRSFLVAAIATISPGKDSDAEFDLLSASCQTAESTWKLIADDAAGQPIAAWTPISAPLSEDFMHGLHDTLQRTLSWMSE